ncbi:MAG: Jag N-terminal domain-containing protein [Anaerolineae bacterium]|nr:Jag N-terminal domain-containing protein [Anaerolineae bacterium]MDX9831869.1 RNA-binding cell elongation regulator Jag/EloR [Anaerolineae bacterium]
MEAKSERSVVVSGKTVEDAINNGLAMLGVRRDQVDVEIITEGSRGVLGFGAEHARVRLAVKVPAAPPVAETPPSPPPKREGPRFRERRPAREPRHAEEVRQVEEVSVAEEPRPAADVRETRIEPGEGTPEAVGQEVLDELLRLMGVRASVDTYLGEDLADEGQPAPIVLNITGEDLGILIGRRGETLRALQYLVRLMVSHRVKHWTNLVVDVESYLARRRNALESLANRVADQAIRSGRTQALEPMPPYERRLVHIALRKHPRVTTQSVGEGERRKVTIVPKK